MSIAFFEMFAPTSCPSDMVLVGTPGSQMAFCIEREERGTEYFYEAWRACSTNDRALCTLNQWWRAHGETGVNNTCNGNWEWVGQRDNRGDGSHYLHTIVGAGSCPWQTDWGWSGKGGNRSGPYNFRCCIGMASAVFE